MKTIKGNWIMEKDEIIEGDLKVEGDIFGKDGIRFNLIVKGNLDCGSLNCKNLDCGSLNCKNLDCGSLNCGILNCGILNCLNLDCGNLSFYAIAIAYKSFKCKTWKANRDNFIIKCLDGEIIGKELKK